MSNLNDVWSQILNQSQETEEKKVDINQLAQQPITQLPKIETIPQTPVVNVSPTLPVIPQPKINVPKLNIPTLSPPNTQLVQPLNIPVVQTPQIPNTQIINPVSETTQQLVHNTIEELTPLNDDSPPWDEEETEDDEDELDEVEYNLDGLNDAPPANNFNLMVPGISVTQQIFSTPTPQAQVTQKKRGPGRPPKINTAAQIITQLPTAIETEQDQHKSIRNTQQVSSSSKQNTETITTTISKSALYEIADSIEKLARVIRFIAQN